MAKTNIFQISEGQLNSLGYFQLRKSNDLGSTFSAYDISFFTEIELTSGSLLTNVKTDALKIDFHLRDSHCIYNFL